MGINLTVALIGWFFLKYGMLFGIVSIRDAVLLSGSAVCIVLTALWEQLDDSCSAVGIEHFVVYVLMATGLQYAHQSRVFGHAAVVVMASRLLAETCILRGVAAIALDLCFAALA